MQHSYDIDRETLRNSQRDPAHRQAVQYETLRAMIDREERVKPAHSCALSLLMIGALLLDDPQPVVAAIALRLGSLLFTKWATARLQKRIGQNQPIGESLYLLRGALALAGATWAILLLSVPANASATATLAIDSVAVLGAALVTITYGQQRSAMWAFAFSFLATAGIGGVVLLGNLPATGFAVLIFLIVGAILFSRGFAEHSIVAAHMTVENRDLSRRLAEALSKAEKLALRDPMTKLFNRRAFFEKFEQPPKADKPRTFIMIDIDHFKRINDICGHAIGDKVIQGVGDQMRALQDRLPNPGGHCCVRLGGEEFVMVLDQVDAGRAKQAAEQLRAQIKLIPRQFIACNGPKVSASIGVAQQQPNETLDEVLRRSDLAMYQAKERGRNQVAMAA